VLCGCLFACALTARADTIWVKSEAGGKPLAYNNVRITKIDKGESADDLFYVLQTGSERSKPLEQIAQIRADDNADLSAAEEAFANGDMKAAGAAYRKVFGSNTAKPWAKRRAQMRLVVAAGQTGDFGDSVIAFLGLVQKTPESAVKNKPQIASATPQQIDAAIASVKSAVASPSASADQKKILLPFLIELYNAKKDTASAEQTMAELTRLNPSAVNSAEAKQARADTALGEAQNALARKNYPQAIATIQSNAALFTEPQQQADALYILAESKSATAEDDTARKDAALAYMRIVANFKNATGAPHVADSLLKTAQIEEALKDTKAAQSLYSQILAEYKDSPAAKIAQARVEALK
jgi:TolA-binding protein